MVLIFACSFAYFRICLKELTKSYLLKAYFVSLEPALFFTLNIGKKFI